MESGKDSFKAFLASVIGDEIPMLYVEGYSAMCGKANSMYPKSPKAMVTSVGYDSNEPFKFWAAGQAERGVKLLGIQHGGGFGSSLLDSLEEHQIRISDTFLTWGWMSDKHENTRPLPAASLNLVREQAKPSSCGRILLVEMALSRYSFIPQFLCGTPSGFMHYLKDQFRFVECLSRESRALLTVRLYSGDYLWSQRERWEDRFSGVQCSDGKNPILEELLRSRLAVCTYNATTFIETFVANYPTVLFWHPERWEVRPAAVPYYNSLRNAGILHDSPESAAAKVDEVADEPMVWWSQPRVQDAKDEFCAQFARTSETWQDVWATEIRRSADLI